MSFNDDIEVSSGQLRRSGQSVLDSKFLLIIEMTSFCFDKNLSFSSSIIFFCIWLFIFEKYGLNAFQNGLELPSTLSFLKYCNLAYLFRFATRFRCHLNFTMSLGHIWIGFETWSGHYLLPKVLIKMGFLILWWNFLFP